MLLRAARGYRIFGETGCRGASWSKQLDGKELRGALGSAIGTEKIPISWILWTAGWLPNCQYDYNVKDVCLLRYDWSNA